MTKRSTVYIGEDAREVAKRAARYGHRDWLIWTARDGQRCAAPCSAQTLKMAMLATGTQGRFTRMDSHGIGWSSSCWAVATLWLKNARYWESQGVYNS